MNESCTAPLAIASIPLQKADMQALHDKTESLDKGTIFPELYLPFFITETEPDTGKTCHIRQLKDNGNEECDLLLEIMETGFYLDDLALYLDNHPEDVKALELYIQQDEQMKQLTSKFAKEYYPLAKSAVPDAGNAKSTFSWTDGPAPWEGVCI